MLAAPHYGTSSNNAPLEGMEKGWPDVTVSDFGGALVKLIGEKEEPIVFPPYRAGVQG